MRECAKSRSCWGARREVSNQYISTFIRRCHHDQHSANDYYSASLVGLRFLKKPVNFKSVISLPARRNDSELDAGKPCRWKFFYTVFLNGAELLMLKKRSARIEKRQWEKWGEQHRWNGCVFVPMFVWRSGLRQQPRVCNWSRCSLTGSCFECSNGFVFRLMD